MSLMCWEADSTNYIPAFFTNTRHSALNPQRPANKAHIQDRGLSLVLINLSKLCETFLVLTAWLLVQSVLIDEFLKLKGVQDLPPQNMQNWILIILSCKHLRLSTLGKGSQISLFLPNSFPGERCPPRSRKSKTFLPLPEWAWTHTHTY